MGKRIDDLRLMLELIHMTAAYSNAVPVVLLSHVSDFAAKLNLPATQPVIAGQVVRAGISRPKAWVQGAVWLTNRYWFGVDHRGFVASFRAPANFFFEQDPANLDKYMGHDHMTTNEVIAMARDVLRRLGCKPAVTRSKKPPILEGPFDHKNDHFPYCRVIWTDHLDMAIAERIVVEVNMETKALMGMSLMLDLTNKLDTIPLKVSVVPELESEYRARMRQK
jgi:hypothetical protein